MNIIAKAQLAAFLIFTILLPGGIEAQKSNTRTQTWWKISFEIPSSFSKPKEIGLDAVALISPADKKPGNGRLEMTLVAVPPDMQAGFGKDDASIMEYIAGAFLGITNKPEEQRSREFLGKAATGAVYSSNIPKKRRIEMYLVHLKGGNEVAVAMTRYGNTSSLEMENVMSLFARTLEQRKSK